MNKRIVIGVSGGLALIIAVVLTGAGLFIWREDRTLEIDQDKFLATARSNDSQLKKMYELDPQAEARFNRGNRAGRRGAFAAISQTFTLSAKVKKGYVIKLFRGIAPRAVSPDGITVAESAYCVESPKGEQADLTEEEFDAILKANGDVGVLKPEVWKRPRLPSKNL